MFLEQDGNRPYPAIPVLIVGGGVAGCTLAYQLARVGVAVTVLEAGQVGRQGASSVPLALLNPHRGRTARASELDLNGLAAMWTIVAELESSGFTTGVHKTGVVRIASSARQARLWRKQALRYLERLDAPYHAPYGALLVTEGGWLEPYVFLNALRAAAGQAGARFIENGKLASLHKTPTGWRVVAAKQTYEAAKVVLAVGASQLMNVDMPELNLPAMERLEGDVVGFAADLDLPIPIAGAVYGAQTSDGVYMGGNHRALAAVDTEALPRLQRAAGWFVPGLIAAPIKTHWTGVRAKRADNLPLVTELEPDLWFYGALGGRGFLCSAYLSRQLAQQL